MKNVQLIQNQEQTQGLKLTPEMRQSLECLQFSALDLLHYVQEASLENPMLQVEAPPMEQISLDAPPAVEMSVTPGDSWDDCFACKGTANTRFDPGSVAANTGGESLRNHLLAQIGQAVWIHAEMQPICRFLVDCLDSRGYLDCPLDVLADETGWSLFQLEQALFAVQMLDPPGVAARSLSECLILQLSQGPHFNAVTLGLARDGLELLAKKQYAELAKRLHTDKKVILSAAEILSRLNPIPAQGYGGEEYDMFVIPDAFIVNEGDSITVELNEASVPRVTVDDGYLAMLACTDDRELADYLREKLQHANGIIRGIDARGCTLRRLLCYIVQLQREFFRGGELLPMTVRGIAGELGISPSTVSRAVKDKYVQFGGRVFPLRTLFSSAVSCGEKRELSSVAVKQRLRMMIQEEDPLRPLSDEAMAALLAKDGITLSRRAVAKYRDQMQIPPAFRRKK